MKDEIGRFRAPENPLQMAKSMQSFCIQYRYPHCPEPKCISDMDPAQNTIEDLMLRICHLENVGNSTGVYLYTVDGMPLTDDPFLNTWSLKDRHIENGAELYAIFTPKQNLKESPAMQRQEAPEELGEDTVRCHVMLRGNFEIKVDLASDTINNLRLKLANESGIPAHVLHYSDKASLFDMVKKFQPANENFNPIRIMLHGPIGAGKSSFINSVNSCLRGRMTHDAHVDAVSNHSFTKKAQTHKIQKGNPGNFYPFVFTDLMGLEENDGITEDDIKRALDGYRAQTHKIQKGNPGNFYPFVFTDLMGLEENDGITEDDIKRALDGYRDPFYNHDPAPEDKTHVLVSVVPADRVSLTSQAVIRKIKLIRRAASDLVIPQICIIPMIDKVSDDIKCVYKMKDVKEKVRLLDNFKDQWEKITLRWP